MGNSVPDLKLFETDSINFVQDVDAWYVNSVVFDRIDELIRSSVAGECDIGVGKLVFFGDRSDLITKGNSHYDLPVHRLNNRAFRRF